MTRSGDFLQAQRIFLGHQSVGQGLLDAVPPGVISVVSWEGGSPPTGPGLLHRKVGQNQAPRTKLAAFEAALEELRGEVDVAALKFCYVDFAASTDAGALFGHLVDLFDRLGSKYPRVRFIHFTAPLTTVQAGPKAWVKRALGRAPWGALENVVRHRYNELLRARLPAASLFDLARLESTRPDGSPERVELEGVPTPALFPGYSTDGGHLTREASARFVARLLAFLADPTAS